MKKKNTRIPQATNLETVSKKSTEYQFNHSNERNLSKTHYFLHITAKSQNFHPSAVQIIFFVMLYAFMCFPQADEYSKYFWCIQYIFRNCVKQI